MAAITFDTLKFVERLKHSGMSEKNAKAISEAFKEAQSEMELATKSDLKELGYQLTIRLGLMLFGGLSLAVAVIKLL